MPYEFFLAFRYLYTRRRRWTTRIATTVAVVGIAFGVAALIVALALANGFQDEMRQKLLSGTAHITAMRTDGRPMTDFRSLIKAIGTVEGVSREAATTYDGALLSGAAGSAFAVLRGIDPQSDESVADLRRMLIMGTVEGVMQNEGPVKASTVPLRHSDNKNSGGPGPAMTSFDEVPSEAALPQVILGSELATRTGLRPGDIGQIVSSEGTLTPLGMAPRYRRVRVAGIFRSGLYEYDASWIYLSLRNTSNFAGTPEVSATAISVQVKDIYEAPAVSSRILSLLGSDFTSVDWEEANRPLFAALALERRMAMFVIFLIILMASLNITTTMVLVVAERRADIAVLSALGARASGIIAVFVIEGVCTGSFGALAGILLGIGACVAGEHFHAVSLPAEVYSVSNVPFHMHYFDALLAGLVAVILSFLATIYPARSAARARPAEALRDA